MLLYLAVYYTAVELYHKHKAKLAGRSDSSADTDSLLPTADNNAVIAATTEKHNLLSNFASSSSSENYGTNHENGHHHATAESAHEHLKEQHPHLHALVPNGIGHSNLKPTTHANSSSARPNSKPSSRAGSRNEPISKATMHPAHPESGNLQRAHDV